MKYFQRPTEHVSANQLVILLFLLAYFTTVSVAWTTRCAMLG
jgi:hypothetical protein